MTYYRIHPAGEAPETILSESRWNSRVWVGESQKPCDECNGQGEVDDDEDEDGRAVTCENCRGEGYVEDVRRGVSCCRSIDDLREYFSGRGANFEGDVLIELDGDLSRDEDWDAADGAVLVLPTRIVGVATITKGDPKWRDILAGTRHSQR